MANRDIGQDMSVMVFVVEGQRYALELDLVERAVRAVRVTSLPNSPPIVSGVIEVDGRILPVVNLRKRLGIEERPLSITDVMILAHTTKRSLVLIADEVEGLLHRKADQVETAEAILPNLPYLRGVARFEDGLVFIHDLDSFLSLDEEKTLDAAMVKAALRG